MQYLSGCLATIDGLPCEVHDPVRAVDLFPPGATLLGLPGNIRQGAGHLPARGFGVTREHDHGVPTPLQLAAESTTDQACRTGHNHAFRVFHRTATFLILESERTHPQAVSSSCFIVDSQRTGTFGSALPFRSHINSPGILRPAVATLQDGQLMPREAGEAVLLRTTANSRPRSNLYP